MHLRLLVVFLLAVTCVGAINWRPQLPNLERALNDLHLRSGETITTNKGKPSFKYSFTDKHLWNGAVQNVRVFGLKASEAATLTLYDPSEDMLAPMQIVLGPETCSATYLSKAPVTYSVPCDLRLRPDEMTWFILETSRSYIAIFRQGWRQPVVDFSVDDLSEPTNLNFYRKFVVSSEGHAVWDMHGEQMPRNVRPVTSTMLVRGMKRVKEDLRLMKEHNWRCEYALAEKSSSNIRLKEKYEKYHKNYCIEFLRPYKAAIPRHEAILRLNGEELPSRSQYDVEHFFIEEYV